MKYLTILAALALLFLSGCATVTRGTTDTVYFNSDPPLASARVLSTNQTCTTPCSMELKRNFQGTVEYTKECYKPNYAQIMSTVSGGGATGFAGNLILGGVIGMAVDAGSGAMKDLSVMPAIVRLEDDGNCENREQTDRLTNASESWLNELQPTGEWIAFANNNQHFAILSAPPHNLAVTCDAKPELWVYTPYLVNEVGRHDVNVKPAVGRAVKTQAYSFPYDHELGSQGTRISVPSEPGKRAKSVALQWLSQGDELTIYGFGPTLIFHTDGFEAAYDAACRGLPETSVAESSEIAERDLYRTDRRSLFRNGSNSSIKVYTRD